MYGVPTMTGQRVHRELAGLPGAPGWPMQGPRDSKSNAILKSSASTYAEWAKWILPVNPDVPADPDQNMDFVQS